MWFVAPERQHTRSNHLIKTFVQRVAVAIRRPPMTSPSVA